MNPAELFPYRPTVLQCQPMDRYPRLAVMYGLIPQHIEDGHDPDKQADSLAALLGLNYPNATWSN